MTNIKIWDANAVSYYTSSKGKITAVILHLRHAPIGGLTVSAVVTRENNGWFVLEGKLR